MAFLITVHFAAAFPVTNTFLFAALHEYHWYLKVIGAVPVQVPATTLTDLPTLALPVTFTPDVKATLVGEGVGVAEADSDGVAVAVGDAESVGVADALGDAVAVGDTDGLTEGVAEADTLGDALGEAL